MSTDDRQQREEDTRKWIQEWRIWLGVSLILTVIWGVRCLVTGEVRFFWPVYAITIYAAIILVAPLFPRGSDSKDT